MNRYLLLFLPGVLCQFVDIGLEPDVAFGDNNDRFDLTGVYEQQKNVYGYDDSDRRRYRRIADTRRAARPVASYRRDDDWLEDMANVAGHLRGDDMVNRAQNFRRQDGGGGGELSGEHDDMEHEIQGDSGGHHTPGKVREIELKYALPVKIRVQDLWNGSYITNIQLL